jgi:catalase (peroxidase I)
LLQPYFANNSSAWDFEWKAKMLRLSPRELVVLSALPRNAKHMAAQGYQPDAQWVTPTPDALTNEYFTTLLNEKWEPSTSPSGTPHPHIQDVDIQIYICRM